jgi:N-acetyltransferase
VHGPGETPGPCCLSDGYDRAMPAIRFDAAPADWVQPVTLHGSIVRLEPLSRDHLDGLAEVAFEPSLWTWTLAQPRDRDALEAWLDAALANAAKGLERPFATVDQASGRPIGSTRFMSIVPEHRRLEIGWTWVAPSHQRRGANQEAKYLQLRHAFEDLGANRVEFKTDSRNDKANPALVSIGATFEGTFRNHMIMPDGPLRHSNYYAVTVEDWPAVKLMLETRIAALRSQE